MTDDKDVVVDDWASMAKRFFESNVPMDEWCIVEDDEGVFGISFGMDAPPAITCADMDTAAVLLGCLLVSKDALRGLEVSPRTNTLIGDNSEFGPS